MADHLGIGMSFPHTYLIPERPPSELLAELDEATRVLDELSARAVELTVGMDRQTRSLRIERREGGTARQLTPTQLFDLLTTT